MDLAREHPHELLRKDGIVVKRHQELALWIDPYSGRDPGNGVTVIVVREEGCLGEQLARSCRV